MEKNTIFLCAGLISAIFFSPVFASKNDDDEKRKPYQEHYKQRHQMNIDMMQMLSETMTILRDINHQPSSEEKARLSDMIKQLDEMMVSHKEMADKAGKYYERGAGHMRDSEDNERRDGRHRDW